MNGNLNFYIFLWKRNRNSLLIGTYSIQITISRYFYLIVFAMYVREAGPKEFPQTFKEWMDQHGSLRDMIAEGRGKLEWERKIPDEKLVDLKEMLASKDFKTNLPKVSFY